METFLKEQKYPSTCLYPLEIEAIPPNERIIIPELECRLVPTASQRAIAGEFTALGATGDNLLSLLETICDPTAEAKEVRS